MIFDMATKGHFEKVSDLLYYKTESNALLNIPDQDESMETQRMNIFEFVDPVLDWVISVFKICLFYCLVVSMLVIGLDS